MYRTNRTPRGTAPRPSGKERLKQPARTQRTRPWDIYRAGSRGPARCSQGGRRKHSLTRGPHRRSHASPRAEPGLSPSAARAGRRLLWGSEPASAAWPVPGSCAGPRPPRKHWQRWHRPDALQEPAGRAGHGGRGERLEGRETVFKAQSKRGAAAGLSQGRKRPCPCPAPGEQAP